MNSDCQRNQFSELPNDAFFTIEKIAISSELVEERINNALSTYSRIIHDSLYNSGIVKSSDHSEAWFQEGFSARMLQPGEHWKEGKIRLRVVAEFIPSLGVETRGDSHCLVPVMSQGFAPAVQLTPPRAVPLEISALSQGLVECFKSVEDPRVERGKWHPLSDILIIAILSTLAGGQGWEAIVSSRL